MGNDFITQAEWQRMTPTERAALLSGGVATKLGRMVEGKIKRTLEQQVAQAEKANPLQPAQWPAQQVKLTLPIPLSVNAAYCDVIITDENGKQHATRTLTEAGRLSKRDMRNLAHGFAQIAKFAIFKGDRLCLHIELYFADMRRDIDDAEKLLIDAIAEGIGFNDNIVDEKHTYRRPIDKDNPHVVVMIEKRRVTAL